jgi:hypothetical protein
VVLHQCAPPVLPQLATPKPPTSAKTSHRPAHATMPVRPFDEKQIKTARYDASVAKSPPPRKISMRTHPVVALRPKLGNRGAKYDPSPGQILKPLRRQFGNSYDAKKSGNTWSWPRSIGPSKRPRNGSAIEHCGMVGNTVSFAINRKAGSTPTVL